MVHFEEWIEKISKEELYNKYVGENLSYIDAAKFYGMGTGMFFRLLKHYGIKKPMDIHVQNIKESKRINHNGDENYNNPEKRAATCLEKYNVDNQFKRKDMMAEVRENNRLKYGTPNNILKNHQTRIKNSGDLATSYKKQVEKIRETVRENYNVDWAAKSEIVKERIRESLKETFLNTRGCENYWASEEAKRSNGSKNSRANEAFSNLLETNNISFEREFNLRGKWYDFKIDNYLVEINPSATHNSTWTPWDAENGIDHYYHAQKTDLATQNGYRCIHVWDWDDQQKIIDIFLKKKEVVGARNCEVRDVPVEEEKEFLTRYHLQGYTPSKKAFGLYENGSELVMLMTFSKPRYSKKYEWELLRLCNSKKVNGGAEKLFKYFIDHIHPESIVSYCDLSKFVGDVYLKLGFKKIRRSIGKHWYNIKLKDHITDKLLFKRGFDNLLGSIFGTFGKGTSNEELMLAHNFVEIYDAGQATYAWVKTKD